MKKLIDLFYAAADKYPQKTAIWCDSKTISYEMLANKVSQYSNYLKCKGIGYGDHIGIPMNNSIESVILILVAMNLGVALVPVNPTLPLETMKVAFESANVKHIIGRKVFLDRCKIEQELNITGQIICTDDYSENYCSLKEAEKLSGERRLSDHITGTEPLIITMTSGSTGMPKPIELTQNNKYLRAMAHIDLYNISEKDNILAATPLYHSLAERLVIIPLLLGATAILLPRFTPEIWMNCIERQKVTFTIAVSAQLSQVATLLESPKWEISSLRCLVSSSALLDSMVKSKLINTLKCDFHEMYGTSETSTITNICFNEVTCHKKSVGQALPQAKIKILKDNGQECEVGEIGEIACKTTLQCNGYYNNSIEFEKTMQCGYFKTGDMGYLDKEGFLYFSGRKKEVIITGGINVYPPDVENCILQLIEVEECAAFAYPSEKLGEVVAIAIVVKPNCELNKRKIQIHCAKKLADFQQPHEIFFIKEMPKNGMGKIVKGKLLEYV